MFTNIISANVHISAASLLDSPALSSVAAWVLFLNGQPAGRVLWVLSTGHDGNCIWKCAIECAEGKAFGIVMRPNDARLTTQIVGKSHNSAGHDQVASFTDCLLNNGLASCGLDCYNPCAAKEYLQRLGFQIYEAL